MSREHLTLLWKWLALGLLLYVLAGVVTVQGGGDIFGGKTGASPEKDGNAVVAYMTVVLGAPLFCLSMLVALLYARRHGTAWHERVPVLLLEGLRTGSWEGRVFQGAVIFVLVLLPLYGIGHSIRIANDGPICEQVPDGSPPGTEARFWPGGHWTILDLPDPIEYAPGRREQLRLVKDEAAAKICKSGFQLDWYTFWFMVVFPGAGMALLLLWIGMLFRPAGRKRAPADPGDAVAGWHQSG
ncbi:hypothetical protein [Ancylobacter lacus]|uniref:hypothetical protein n=1 Tax=Ancylobacter lacus TaxID=2579970 RepID=UPI001BCEDDA0|nr:hypothetical protein [Ancylobacter lacus]MBS7539003.1 hypothetical protein [Ancylobacter lacus]